MKPLIKISFLKIFILTISLMIVSEKACSQDFKIEISVRTVPQFFCSSHIGTIGYYVSKNNIVGVGSGWLSMYDDASPGDAEFIPLSLYYRRYLPLGNSRLSFAFDFFIGGQRCIYSSKFYHRIHRSTSKKGEWDFYFSFQPSFNVGLGKSQRVKLFIGQSFVPTYGFHLGCTIGL